MNPAALDLHIETLVLDGFATSDGPTLRAAIERELARLLADRGAPPSLKETTSIDRIDGGSFGVPQGSGSTSQVGRQVAGTIYRGLGR